MASPGLEPENWARFVLPAPARRVAERIAALTEARRDIEEFTGKRCFLSLHVKVLKDWRNSDRALKSFGYALED